MRFYSFGILIAALVKTFWPPAPAMVFNRPARGTGDDMMNVTPNAGVVLTFDIYAERYRTMGKETAREYYIPQLTQQIVESWREDSPDVSWAFHIHRDDPLFRAARRTEYIDAVRLEVMRHFEVKYVTIEPPDDSDPFFNIKIFRSVWTYRFDKAFMNFVKWMRVE